MDSPIMYYALDVRRVIPSVSPGCGRRPLGRRSFPNVGEKKSSRDPVFAANKNSDWRSRARAYLQSRFTNRRGVGRGNGRLQCWACTPPRKIRLQFRGYKHTSLNLIGDESSGVRHSSAEKTSFVTVVVTVRRRWCCRVVLS